MKFPKWMYVGLLLLAAVAGCRKRSPSRESQVKEADQLLASQEFHQATITYHAAARNGPPDAQLFLKTARTGLIAGPFNLVTDAAVRAADLMPDDLDVQILAAGMMLPTRRYDQVA